MKMKAINPRPVLTVLALCAFGATLAAASPFPQARNRERLRENLLTLRLLRMTQALDLTEEQSAKIYPVINRIEKEKLDIQRRLGPEIEGLRAAADKAAPDEAEILAGIGRVRTLRDQIKGKDEELEAFLAANLTLVQKAKYLIFSVDFYRQLGQVLEKTRRPGLTDRRGF
jgi:Spy/CpxP family protein refolding chaperone